MSSPLHHLDEGSGPVVVLLHAGVADLRMWDHQAAALAADHRVVRCDLHGFGQTPLTPGEPYSDAEDVVRLLDELGVGEFALVGASQGGDVALQVASAVPERVTRLVLLCAALMLPLGPSWARETAEPGPIHADAATCGSFPSSSNSIVGYALVAARFGSTQPGRG